MHQKHQAESHTNRPTAYPDDLETKNSGDRKGTAPRSDETEKAPIRERKGPVAITAELMESLEAYLEENYISEGYGIFAEAEMILPEAENFGALFTSEVKNQSLEEAVRHLGESFQERLLRMIDERGMTDPEVYKRAHLDRKLFSKIRCSPRYVPKKRTVTALAIALELNIDDAADLLASAGYALANNSKSDVIVSFCIENGIYDLFEVNELLDRYHQPPLS